MRTQLQKTIGLSAALSTVVGMVIGSGVFFKPQAIYTTTNGAPGLGIIAWLLGGFITITAGLTATEISAAIPKTGGMMIYIEEIYGEKLGFLTGWMQTVLFFPGTSAALGVIFAQQASELLNMSPNNMSVVLPIAIGVILFLSLLNIIGSSLGGKVQTVATIGKMIPLALIIIFGFIKGQSSEILNPFVGDGVSVSSALGQVLIATLFAYDGWINVGAISGEMKSPEKDLPRAIVGGLSLVMAIYIIINVAYLWVVPASELATVTSPATLVAKKLFGNLGGKVITVGILISVFGTLNGYLLTGSRIPYTLAEKGTLPASKVLLKVNSGGSPVNSILLITVLACIYALSGQFNLLTDLTIFSIWVFYVLTFVGVIRLRREQPDLHRPYKVPLYPIIPIIAILGGLFVIINQILTSTAVSLGGIFITLLGLPVYYYMKKK
ncbi:MULTISPECIES: APC family permease [unclassified Clostridioides]|uniref:APC family permease n=1 Tax=unclassified Clostridioides TaxID=2635829 RepID=UPI001D0C3FF3|nr:amino acid permease [Clostridioides sp. ES-S-0001-02]MCC0639186.1 amino acid permease [Clostridioides sp. ES-S-0049-03]MCC0672499.1 amino acid permease [Clostridioides sp. ES-S-0145-01]MCC0675576.1 amino acid permease [Clostridioides sp. ES-W-0018-02]MCC0695340.1 amino acid permease [Clostridioides sp. ES-S-0048-02]MCC0707621.1 amino acid permease [Clostridioides sp. ES-S-0190-01]MCC0709615.1 amino acid permease [Clostridioides sp. ES-W-0017-02]MCC0761611.1 amino acid permease [Clostridio